MPFHHHLRRPRFPSPTGLGPVVGMPFRAPSGYCARVLALLESRSFVLSFLAPTAGFRRVSSTAPRVRSNKLCNNPVATTDTGYGRISGFAAARQLAHPVGLTALHFRSRPSHIYGFHQTHP